MKLANGYPILLAFIEADDDSQTWDGVVLAEWDTGQFVTWRVSGTNSEKLQANWGHYTIDLDEAKADFWERAERFKS